MSLASIVDEVVNPEDLEKTHELYEKQSRRGSPDPLAVFNYSYSLTRSTKSNVKTGIFLFEGLLKNEETKDVQKRDIVFYLAIAYTRLKDYDRALEYINLLITAEPENNQALELKALIEKRMKKDGLLGLALLAFGGGAAIAAGLATVALIARR